LDSSSKKKRKKERRKSIEPKYSSKSSKFKREKYPLKEQSKIRFHVFTLAMSHPLSPLFHHISTTTYIPIPHI
jgi:hypothetical protein